MLHLNSAADATCLHSRLSLSLSFSRFPYSSHNIEDILQKSPRGLFMCVLKRKTGTHCDS